MSWRGAWSRLFRPKSRSTPEDVPEVIDPTLAQVRALIATAEEAARIRITTALLNSAALRVAMDLDQVCISSLGIQENEDHSVSVLFLRPADFGQLMWTLGSSGTLISIRLKARLPDCLMYDADFQSMSVLLTVHMKARTQLSTKLTLST